MPQPTGSRRPSPEELAKRIAARLAESGQPITKRSSLRHSVLVARLVSGVIVLSTAAVLVLGIFAGVDLLVDNTAAEPPQVLSLEISREDIPTTTKGVPTSRDLEDFIGISVQNPTETTGLGLVTTTIPGAGGIGVPMPAAPTTSTTAPGIPVSTTVGSNTTIPPQVTTTQPSTSSTSGGSMTTTSTSTSTAPKPTIPSTTTTVTIPTTTAPTTTAPTTTVTIPTTTAPTTSIPTTTTTEASTTTTVEDTTTTCTRKGGGQGKC